ncbi:hypothetical protein RVR_10104 [Actinacidiphila reveromycinica]|uniref:Uncharacterized protein n=1 Tax=Actinacidiphila reveromycinica TaxID=659352 RepID=A0A7U3VST6_9ACTN|nr:hypothetical protein [Streptomyces sp. SN-593]BBB02261.1 hypothetical protein RVR_10104 [Streptomyces sp. SN-593]
MGHKFSLVLSREITDEESALLEKAGFNGAVFGKDTLPTDAGVPVTKVDFDDTVTPSLAEAIETALEAVKQVPDLSVPGLNVPAVPKAAAGAEGTDDADVVAGEVVTDAAAAE